MPFQMIVQHAFTERLADGGFRIRNAADLIEDAGQVAALEGNPHVVRIWVDDSAPAAEPEVAATAAARLPAAAKQASPDFPSSSDPAAAPAKQ